MDARNGGTTCAHRAENAGDERPQVAQTDRHTVKLDQSILAALHRASLYELAELSASASHSVRALSSGLLGRREALSDIARRTIPRWHFAMLNDNERNDAFAVALERRVRPGAHVLDIGGGTGLLAMMAVQAGAGRVTTCEANPLLAEIATHVVAENGMADVITVLPLHSTDLRVGYELPRPADLIVSEIVDCGLIGEAILPTMRHARRELLAPGGELLPRSGKALGFLVESDALTRLNRVQFAGGFDVRLMNTVSTAGHFPVRLNTWPHRRISGAVELFHFDLASDSLEDGCRRVRFPGQTGGRADGVIAWFELDLGSDVIIRNSPDNLASHRMQAFLPFDEPVVLGGSGEFEVEVAWRDTRLFANPLSITVGVN